MFHQQLIITCVLMADMGNDREAQGFRIEFLRRSRTPDATGMFPAQPQYSALSFPAMAAS